MCSKLALHPERRWEEPWRYLTYGLVHKDYSHLLKNIAGLAMAGMILEYYHKSWRVFLVYAAGVVVGGIGRINPVARKTPLTPLVGSSGKQDIVDIQYDNNDHYSYRDHRTKHQGIKISSGQRYMSHFNLDRRLNVYITFQGHNQPCDH